MTSTIITRNKTASRMYPCSPPRFALVFGLVIASSIGDSIRKRQGLGIVVAQIRHLHRVRIHGNHLVAMIHDLPRRRLEDIVAMEQKRLFLAVLGGRVA